MHSDELVWEERDGWDGRSHLRYPWLSNKERANYVRSNFRSKNGTEPIHSGVAAMAMAMRCLPHHLVGRQITIFTSNLGALLAASQPRHQSGQASIEVLYNAAHALRKGGNSISLVWVPSQGDFDLSRRAKEAARRAVEHGRSPEAQHRQSKSTVINNARAKRGTRILPEEVGKYSREIDTALPGKHTRTLYDGLKRREASVLAQL